MATTTTVVKYFDEEKPKAPSYASYNAPLQPAQTAPATPPPPTSAPAKEPAIPLPLNAAALAAQKEQQQSWTKVFTRRTFLNDLKLCLKDLVMLDSSREGGVTEADIETRAFCISIEKIFLHGLLSPPNQKSTTVEKRKDYWTPLTEWLSTTPDSREVLDIVAKRAQAATPWGKGRAWVYISLSSGTLEQNLISFVQHQNIVSRWYNTNSVWRNEEATVVVGLMRQLGTIRFRIKIPRVNFDELHIAKPAEPIPFGKTEHHSFRTVIYDPEDNSPDNKPKSHSAPKFNIEMKNPKKDETIGLFTELENRSKSLLALSPLATLDTFKEKPPTDKLSILSEEADQLDLLVLDLKKTWTNKVAGHSEPNPETIAKDDSAENRVSNIVVALSSKLKHIIDGNQALWTDVRSNEKKMEELRTEQELKYQALEAVLQKQREEHEMDRLKLKAAENTNIELAAKIQTLDSKLTEEKELRELDAKRFDANASQIEDLENQLKSTALKLQQQISYSETVEFVLEELTQKMEAVALEKLSQDEEEAANLKEIKVGIASSREARSNGADAAWTPDDAKLECTNCWKLFTFTKRRHHCRRCGKLYCSACSANRVILGNNPKPVRCCDPCFLQMKST